MFNNKRIEALEEAIKALQQEKHYYLSRFERLDYKVLLLAEYFGVRLEDGQRVVKLPKTKEI